MVVAVGLDIVARWSEHLTRRTTRWRRREDDLAIGSGAPYEWHVWIRKQGSVRFPVKGTSQPTAIGGIVQILDWIMVAITVGVVGWALRRSAGS